MRIVRYSRQGEVGFGILEGETVSPIGPHPFGAFEYTGQELPAGEVRLLAPVLPSKVVAVGRNYAEHARELGNELPPAPMLFLKPSTSVVGPGDPIVRPEGVGQVDYEGELAVVVGKLVRRLAPADAIQAVLGFTCANDVTARDLQRTDGQWTRAKGFDTFCPLGPWIETDLDSSDLAISTLVNGETRQQARTSQLEHGVAELLAFVSRVMTLLPGDVLLTGTPAGVGPLEPGDRVEVEVEGVGVLANEVVAEPARGPRASTG
jgi:2-keto-4-pentenoate hydratase/2-oxohepta-3-ene-1,7-dioic acid hydratase in catechol pathway